MIYNTLKIQTVIKNRELRNYQGIIPLWKVAVQNLALYYTKFNNLEKSLVIGEVWGMQHCCESIFQANFLFFNAQKAK